MKLPILSRFPGVLICLLLFAAPLSAAEYSDKQLTLDLNAVVALVATNYDDHVASFLVRGTSSIRGDAVIPSAIAKNELNKIDGQESIQLPLARLMRRMALRIESAKDAREYAFLKLKRMAVQKKEIEQMLMEAATEISKRDNDDLKIMATGYVHKPK